VTVYSYLERDQRVTLELASDGLSFVGARSATVDLAPKEARGLRFTVKADKAGERSLAIRATTPGHADAIERKLTIVPNGFKVVRTVNARLTAAATSSIELPAEAIDGGSDLFVKVYGGPLSQVAEGLDGVFQMPHGCFEQTSSTTYPSVLALDFLKRSKAVSPALEARARGYIKDGYQRLVSFEVSGGGFSLFGKAPAETVLTAYGLMEFVDMARVGGVGQVDEALVARTRSWLYRARSATGGWPGKSHLPKGATPPDDVLTTAYVAWALASGAAPGSADAQLGSVLDVVKAADGKDAVDAYALALRANALLAGGRASDAAPLLDRLARLAEKDGDGVHWSSSAVGVMYSSGASLSVEVTGLATHALALAGRDAELRVGALSWLVAQRGRYGTWSTTQATIAAMRALLDEAKPAPKEPQDVTVTLDGTAVQTLRLEPNARDVHQLVSLRKWATAGAHKLEMTATGSADVSYQLVGIHYLPWQRQNVAPGSLSLKVAYEPASVAVGGISDCRVHLVWRGKEAARMPLVEVGVPPAFEVETDELDRLLAKSDARVQRYTVERGKVTLYLTDLPGEAPLDVDLPLRALRPAQVVVPSSEAYLYYEPEVWTQTPPSAMRAL
jgi:uncharacterized protein YfaS (alpha-2-macroglobulin family)